MEPSIKNYGVWLTWWAHFLDKSHWWRELASIPDVEDLRRLAWKIHTSFLIPAVRCETLQNQDYTMPSAPKCLSRSRFLPNHPTYQDICQQTLLLSYFIFSKQDIFCNLGGTVPEARSKDMEAPQEGTIALPTTAAIGGVEPCPAKTQRADDTILASPGCTPDNQSPPAEPTTLPAQINLPGSAEISQRGSTMMPLA